MLRNTESNGEPIWKGWQVIFCLRDQYSTDIGGEEMLGDMKEDRQISTKIRNTPYSPKLRR
jgi:hypothetical protein